MSSLQLREFEPADAPAFRALNAEWIERYFRLEPPDEAVLSNPQGLILDRGGRIFFALRDGEHLGCCALIRAADGEFELAKMAVTARAQGVGIGRALLTAAIGAARRDGGRRGVLESTSALVPAVRLYESAGFRHIPAGQVHPSAYARSDVAMELIL
jgi:putative acetyltransferase